MIEHLSGAAAQARAGEIATILAQSFGSPAQRWSAGSVASTLSTPGTVALLAAGGCAVLRVVADEAELLTIAVSPEARGRGLGRRLMAACIECAADAGAGRLHLEVAAGNAAAIGLYTMAGFAETGRRPRYYDGPQGREDAVLMARPTAAGTGG